MTDNVRPITAVDKAITDPALIDEMSRAVLHCTDCDDPVIGYILITISAREEYGVNYGGKCKVLPMVGALQDVQRTLLNGLAASNNKP